MHAMKRILIAAAVGLLALLPSHADAQRRMERLFYYTDNQAAWESLQREHQRDLAAGTWRLLGG
jgi:hypothetical protein